MDTESVLEFLGGVPLLQRLPSSSIKKIAQHVKIKHFEFEISYMIFVDILDSGEAVLRNGVDGDGVYFIWEGEVEVYGHGQDEIHPEFQLKRYDYFGNFFSSSGQQADVTSASKLTCLVLPHEYLYLLRPKSMWNADESQDTCSLLESILHLNSIEVNLFQGITLPDAPRFGKVFGGQFMGQALAAASKTVDCLKIFHHFQAYFLLVGDLDLPIIYEVHRVFDGKSFATRRVDAKQKGKTVFTLLVSFQKEWKGFEHQIPVIPSVPPPEELLSMDELRERRIFDPRLPRTYRNKIATTTFKPWPIEIRFCEPNTSTNQTKSPPSLRFWFRAKGKLADDQALHRCVVAYLSDLMFIEVSSNPHRRPGLKIVCLSLNHTMWFHRNVKADDWILFLVDSPTAGDGRGISRGKMFNRSGELVVTLVQEGLLRETKLPNAGIRAKY
ncbi:hypothetical protein V2J09_008460 [Rumex salicifolius]